jgi:hypothetical protein
VGQCGPGLKPLGPACIPIFDECKEDEVPLLGGGCKKVGVEECEIDGGLKAPRDWTCQRVGVVECEPSRHRTEAMAAQLSLPGLTAETTVPSAVSLSLPGADRLSDGRNVSPGRCFTVTSRGR